MGVGQQAFFLHGGPGLNAGVERLWHGSSLPVSWWDQPAVGACATPFASLVEAAAAQLEKMAAAAPIWLIAHSFGGQIAYALARDRPQLIGRITLLASATDPASAILRLGRRIAQAGGSAAVAAAVAAAEAELNAETFQAMVFAAAADAAYPGVYFGPGSTAIRERFLALQPQIPPLDLDSFLAVMQGFLQAPPLAALSGFEGRVDLIMGRHDPLATAQVDGLAWQRIFPQARIATLDCGHFVHLETPPAAWLQPA